MICCARNPVKSREILTSEGLSYIIHGLQDWEKTAVYKKLELKGEKNKTSFFASMMIDCPMYKQIEECLDKLWDYMPLWTE